MSHEAYEGLTELHEVFAISVFDFSLSIPCAQASHTLVCGMFQHARETMFGRISRLYLHKEASSMASVRSRGSITHDWNDLHNERDVILLRHKIFL
jgi:hypothetical protein